MNWIITLCFVFATINLYASAFRIDQVMKKQHGPPKKSFKKVPSSAQVMAATQFVKDAIAQDPIVIFSKSDCGYCQMAKECFDKLKATVKTIELDKREDMDDIQDALEGITGARSVPRVFVNGVFIGGGSDVRKMSQNGKLAELLNKST